MKLFISVAATTNDSKDDRYAHAMDLLEKVVKALEKQADPAQYKFAHKDWSSGYKVLHTKALEAQKEIEKGADALVVMQRLKKVVTGGVETNMISRAIDLLKESDYNRLRWLWKHHKDKMSAWERTFVTSIGTQLKAGKELSRQQSDHVTRILFKYDVPFDAVASCALS